MQVLITALCGDRGIDIEIREQYAGKLLIVSLQQAPGATNHVLIVNCHQDGQVKTQIRTQYASLVAAGYTKIIGLRDVFPFAHADLPKLKAATNTGLPSGPIPVCLHFAILEVEAWFLDEITHFERIDPGLTPAAIAAGGFDLLNKCGETWPHPAKALDEIYQLAQKRYRKKRRHIERTMSALCPEELYVTVRNRAASFDGFLSSLEASLF
ncbi:MAG TPA: hypothetical protein PLW86_13035 [Rhodocyclaceae bacterium]|nr:hypothetical protein [Rhodocyclaceae bacterium]